MNKKFVCVICPLGCEIEVAHDFSGIKKITGNSCEKGREYVVEEICNPKRFLTTTIKVKNGDEPVVSVKTSKAVPKKVIFDIMKKLYYVEKEAPIKSGDTVISNILETGADIVATKNVKVRR